MATLDELLVRIDASTELLRRELQKGTQTVDKFGKNVDTRLERVDKKFRSLSAGAKKALTAFAAAFSVRQITRFTKEAIAAGDAIGKASKTAGIGAEALQELRFAFGQLAGTTDKEVDESIRRFNRRMGLAVQGMGEAKTTFAAMGVQFRNTNGEIRETEDVLEEVIQKLAAIENDAVRAARASQVFGEDAGPRLAAALGEGVQAMEALRRATPGVLSNETVEDAERLTDAFDKLAREIGGGLHQEIIRATADLAEFFGLIERGPEVTRARESLDLALKAASVQQELIVAERKAADIAARRGRSLERYPGGSFFTPSEEDVAEARANADALIAELEDLQRRLEEVQARPTKKNTTGQQSSIGLDFLDPSGVVNRASRGIARAAGARIDDARVALRDLANMLESIDSPLLRLLDPAPTTERGRATGAARGQARARAQEVIDSVNWIVEKSDEAASEAEERWRDFGASVGISMRSAFTDLFLGIENDWGSLLRRMAAEFLANQVLSGFASIIPINNPIGAFFSGITGRASGGPLAAGQPALVGERGPELFVPNIAGSVLNSKQLSGLGVTLHQVNNIDARGADPAVLGRLGPVLEQNRRQTVAEVKHLLDRRRL